MEQSCLAASLPMTEGHVLLVALHPALLILTAGVLPKGELLAQAEISSLIVLNDGILCQF